MNSTIPADLLELKARFETSRTNRKYVREPIPVELWDAATDLGRHYPTLSRRATAGRQFIWLSPSAKGSSNKARLLRCN